MPLELLERIMSPEEKDTLIDFASIEKNLDHVHQRNRGIEAIPIAKIVGSIGRYQDFTEGFLPNRSRISDKYESVRQALMAGHTLPPIKVYQILDNYFVIDGHHRVTIAKNELKAVYIDAEVTEIHFDFELSATKSYSYDTEQARTFLIHLEEDAFKNKTFLNNAILRYPLTVTELTAFGKIFEEIADFHHNYNNGELVKEHIVFASLLWYEKRFMPAVTIIIAEDILGTFPNRTYTDLYIWIQQHKYYLSQHAGYDVGFDYTVDDFMQRFSKATFFDVIPQIMQAIVRHIKREIRKI